ncbi:MAG: CHAT domain-containing protein [Firmicutes bacterium]|nr:CHAT domain-containing protein [Bacillota bacterium]
MAMIETYRNNVMRKKDELAKLSQDKANESKKVSTQQQKVLSAKSTMTSTKSQSTIKSKLNEIARAESEISKANDKIAAIDKKIAQKEKDISTEEKKLRAEELRVQKKSQAEEKKRLDHNKREMQAIANTLTQHGMMQEDLRRAVIDLQKIPERIKVLFMASNPIVSVPLRLDEEARAIHETITKSKHRDSVEFVTRWAVRSPDILQAINEVNPDVIHFSGHGTATDELVLQNTDGSPKLITKEAIVQTIATVSDKVRLVFFNTCFSFGQAEAIVEHIEAAIGMTTSIGDDAARVFAAQFYSAIGFGLNLEKSFRQAKAALLLEGMPEENTPELCVKEGLHAEDIFIVRPV